MTVPAGSVNGWRKRNGCANRLSYPCSQTSGSTVPPGRHGDDPHRAPRGHLLGHQSVKDDCLPQRRRTGDGDSVLQPALPESRS